MTGDAVSARRPPRPWRIAVALGRVEGRRLAGPTVAAAVLSGFLFLGVGRPEDVIDWRRASVEVVFAVFPLAAATLVCVTLAVLRGRRDRTEELFAALPAGDATRTGAHLVSVAYPVVVASLLLALYVAFVRFRWDNYGPIDVLELAVGPALVLGAGGLAVLLARWTGSSFSAPLACLGVALVQVALLDGDRLFSNVRRLAFWVYHGDMPLELLAPRHAGWHLLYLLGLTGMGAVGALARPDVRTPVVIAGVTAVTVVAVSASVLAWPEPASTWAARNDRLARPAAHQTCEDRAGTSFCAYPEYRALMDYWEAPLAAVRRAVPPAAWPRLAVTQRVQPRDRQWVADSVTADHLPDLVSQQGIVADDGDVHPGLFWNHTGLGDLDVALAAAARVTGLPMSPSPSGVRCDASGQARAVTALWLAGQSTPKAERALGDLVTANASLPGGVDYGTVEIDMALQLLERPQADVPILTTAAFATQDLAKRLEIELDVPRTAPRLPTSPPPPILRLPCP